MSYFNDTGTNGFDQKRFIKRMAIDFDHYLNQGKEHLIHDQLYKHIVSIAEKPQNCVEIANKFFIWIGTIKLHNLEYINIWRESYGRSSITIYYDSHFLLFGKVKSIFNKIFYISADTNKKEIIHKQNIFFRSIRKIYRENMSFDDAFILLIEGYSKEIAWSLKNLLRLYRLKIKILSRHYHFKDINTIEFLWSEYPLQSIYFMELSLRMNPASASDILRLLLLYYYGGMYIDADTLPSLDEIYGDEIHHKNNKLLDVVKSEYFIQKKFKKYTSSQENPIQIFEKILHRDNKDTLSNLKEKIQEYNGQSLSPIPIYTHIDLISLAAYKNSLSFNNNVLIAHKKSKLIRIIIRECLRRYHFIFNNNFHLSPQPLSPSLSGHYLKGLVNYRYDGLVKGNCVTMFLTGPSLILEVVIGAAYEVLDLDKNISPKAVSYALRSPVIAVSCTNHTNYTPEHLVSSWMK